MSCTGILSGKYLIVMMLFVKDSFKHAREQSTDI